MVGWLAPDLRTTLICYRWHQPVAGLGVHVASVVRDLF